MKKFQKKLTGLEPEDKNIKHMKKFDSHTLIGPGDDDYGRKPPFWKKPPYNIKEGHVGPLPDDWEALLKMFKDHPPIDDSKEKCVNCDIQTNVPKNQCVETRAYYVEGGGQLCEKCYEKIYGPRITKP